MILTLTSDDIILEFGRCGCNSDNVRRRLKESKEVKIIAFKKNLTFFKNETKDLLSDD